MDTLLEALLGYIHSNFTKKEAFPKQLTPGYINKITSIRSSRRRATLVLEHSSKSQDLLELLSSPYSPMCAFVGVTPQRP